MPKTSDAFYETLRDHGVPEGDFEYHLQNFMDQNYSWDDAGYTQYVTFEDLETPDYDVPDEFLADAKSFPIGAEFLGIAQIKEYRDERIYIPTSDSCGLKCFQEYFNHIGVEFKPKTAKVDVFLQNPRALYTLIDSGLPDGFDRLDAPKFYKYRSGKLTPLVDHGKGKATSAIVLFPIYKARNKLTGDLITMESSKHKFTYHAVLVWDKKDIRKHSELMEYIRPRISFGKNTILSDDWIAIQADKRKKPFYNYVVWDIETYSDRDETGKLTNLIPWSVGFGYVKAGVPICDEDDVHIISGDDCIEDFLERICIENSDVKSLFLFAHNSSRFDSRYIIAAKGITKLDSIGKGSQLKRLVVRYKDYKTELVFLDSCLYTLSSLKGSCKSLGVPKEYMKQEFDIAGKSKEWYIENTNSKEPENNWEKYLKYDVISLSHVCAKFDENVKEFDACMTSSCGLPGIVWKFLLRSCAHLNGNVYRSKDPTTVAFMKSACYGGRILHWKKGFKVDERCSGLVSLDANSLYPSAMALGEYPVGRGAVYNEYTLEMLEKNLKVGHLFIAEIEFDTPNIRYPIHPWRTPEGTIVYRCGKGLRGVYTSVEIEEMRHDGYTITRCYRAVVWSKKAKIFEEKIRYLYDKRAELKAQGSSLEYVYKIFQNAAYGKFLEQIEGTKTYNTKGVGKELGNGWFESNVKYDHAMVKKPCQIGAFILSNSRKIMNNYIRQLRPKNIYYGDTDSLYTTREAVEASGIKFGSGLGEMKNDYGDGKYIKHAIFLDIKRYLLIFEDDHYTCKFTGLKCGKTPEGDTGFAVSNELSSPKVSKDELIKVYEGLWMNPDTPITVVQEVWKRNGVCVRICEEDKKFIVSPGKRAEWQTSREGCNNFYPLGFDRGNKGLAISKYLTSFSHERGRNYYVSSKFGLRPTTPIRGKKTVVITKEYAEKEGLDLKKVDSPVMTDNGVRIQRESKLFETDKHGMTDEDSDPNNRVLAILICVQEDVELKGSTKIHPDPKEMGKLLCTNISILRRMKEAEKEKEGFEDLCSDERKARREIGKLWLDGFIHIIEHNPLS